MDPLEIVNPAKDTTFAFMEAAQARGHEIYFVPAAGLSICEIEMRFQAEQVKTQRGADFPFERLERCQLTATETDAVFLRSEPPFDAQYLMHTWMLDHAKHKTFIMNDPSGVRTVNEKVWALQFNDFIPPTYLGRNLSELKDFLIRYGRIVAKPTDGFGGQGVFLLNDGDTNASVVFETLSDMGKRDIIAQAFIEEASKGDKRILLLNGEPMGAILRLHSDEDHRNNFFAGGKPVKATLMERDLEICAALKEPLKALGLHFVGIDIIGGTLIEVNVTCPTGIQEMTAHDGINYSEQVIQYVEEQVRG